MTALWMVYAVAVGAGLLAGAASVAGLLRRWGRPERGIWAGALLLACGLPLAIPLLRLRGAALPAEAGSTAARGLLGVPRVVPVPEAVAVPDATPWLLLGWATVSLVYLAWIAVGGVRLRRARRGAPSVPHSSGRILLTPTTGPGVAGLLSPAILLPRWLQELPPEMRRWVIRHEISHLRGRDLPLRHLALVSRVLMPWNPAVWLLSGRLSRALETDCDRRVLRRRPDLRGYAGTLLSVAGRATPCPLPLGAFDARISSLEHRIRTMTTRTAPVTPLRALLLLLPAPAALAVACEMPSPSPTAPVPDPVPEEVTPIRADQLGDEPTFTPYTVAPDIRNRGEVVAELERAYPVELRDRGVGGRTIIWFFINAQGVVEDVRVQQSSGTPELDRAALQVASVMRFTPALNREEPVPVWVAFPITFAVR